MLVYFIIATFGNVAFIIWRTKLLFRTGDMSYLLDVVIDVGCTALLAYLFKGTFGGMVIASGTSILITISLPWLLA